MSARPVRQSASALDTFSRSLTTRWPFLTVAVMNASGIIFLHFNLVHSHFPVESPTCLYLARNVLREQPDFKRIFDEAILKIKLERTEPGSHQHYFWILRNWLENDTNPELPKTPAHLSDTITKFRKLMAEAYETKSYEHYVEPDFSDAFRLWSEQNFRVITFSEELAEADQKEIVDLAIPGNDLKYLKLDKTDADSIFRELSAYFPEDRDRCFLLLSDSSYKTTYPWRKQKLKTVLLGSLAPDKPRLEHGYSLHISKLTDFNPEQEVQREFY